MFKKSFFASVNHKKNSGMAIFVVMGIIAVMAILAVMAQKFTSRQKRMVVKGISDTQADFLLKAAIEASLTKMVKEANDFNTATTSKQIKAPMQKNGTTSGDGADQDLNFVSTPIITFTKDDLKLDELAAQMGMSINDLNVEIRIGLARSIESESPYTVIGLEKKPWMRDPTLKYVRDNYIEPWEISLPEFKLSDFLNFKASITIAGISIPVPLPIGKAIDAIFSGTNFQLPTFKMDTLFNALFGWSGFTFPIKIQLDISTSGVPSFSNLWPAGITNPATGDEPPADWVCEKYGKLNIYAEIDLKSEIGMEYKRGASTNIEFKVADCQPPAALYSFFVENKDPSNLMDPNAFNLPDQGFGNSSGKRLYVNSTGFDFYKQVAAGTVSNNLKLTISDPNAASFPGLVRVNGPNEYWVNLSWFKPELPFFNGNTLLEPAKEFPGLMLDLAKAIPSIEPKTLTDIGISSLGAIIGSVIGGVIDSVKTYFSGGVSTEAQENKTIFQKAKDFLANNWMDWITKAASKWTWPPSYFPKIIGNLSSTASIDLSLVFLPNPFHGGNVSFLFGEYYIFPPLWREIEGNVMAMKYQWNMFLITGLVAPGDTLAVGIPLMIPLMIMEKEIKPPLKNHKYTYCNQSALGGASLGTMFNDALNTLTGKKIGGVKDSNSLVLPPMECRDLAVCDMAIDKSYGATALYSKDHYKKKATLYYESQEVFNSDFLNYFDGDFYNPPGVVYLDYANPVFPPASFTGSSLNVSGRGLIVSDGNLQIRTNILQGEWNGTENPVSRFSTRRKNTSLVLMALDGKLQFSQTGPQVVEASCYGYFGLQALGKLKIHGNFVCNVYDNSGIADEVVIDFQSSRTRCSYFSTKPGVGKFDPRRYNLSFGQRSNISYKLQAN